MRTTTSITFPWLNEKPFSFDSHSLESNCHQSSLLVRSPSNSMFYQSVRVSNKAIENLLLISSLYNEN